MARRPARQRGKPGHSAQGAPCQRQREGQDVAPAEVCPGVPDTDPWFLGPPARPPTDPVSQARFCPPAMAVADALSRRGRGRGRAADGGGTRASGLWRAAVTEQRPQARGPRAPARTRPRRGGGSPPAKPAEGLTPWSATAHCSHRGHSGPSGCWPHPPDLSRPGPALGAPGRFPGVCSAHGDVGQAPARPGRPRGRAVLLAVTLLPPRVPSRGTRCRCL